MKIVCVYIIHENKKHVDIRMTDCRKKRRQTLR